MRDGLAICVEKEAKNITSLALMGRKNMLSRSKGKRAFLSVEFVQGDNERCRSAYTTTALHVSTLE